MTGQASAADLLARAAVLSTFDLGAFSAGTDDTTMVTFLQDECGRVETPGGGRAWITYTRVRGGGCYAYQVDGTGFSEVIVFRAVA